MQWGYDTESPAGKQGKKHYETDRDNYHKR
jgi:hypothetical protein